MAEQVSHNVVNVPESASGSSPLVDVVANHTSTSSAESGNTLPTAIPTKPTDASDPQNDLTADAIAPDTTSVDAGQAAAEPSAGDAVAKPDNIPAIAQPLKTDDQSKAGQTPTVNGTLDSASQGSALEDGGSQDNSAVNSDTDMSKGDVSEAKDGHLHVRTNSVKKPTTFSKISVTKNFLAKSNSAAPTAAKTGERASPVSSVAPPVAKPRLIAKTGASLRELQKARQNAESPSGPDASKVWNKNRPTAPPPPKQFTDEELKQQYGIHLATRLQSDENGKESKWADIDEDEDDWVPDAVTWIDGTKSALTPADNTPASKDAKPAEPTSAKPAEEPKPSLTAMKKPAEPSGPPKTILKPGAAAQAKQIGLANQSSSAPEKATLKAKSPAPPSKSPWATLPPVDKVSPVNPPVQSTQQQTPFVSQDARAYDSMPPHQPMREIAADTFDRSWREGEGGRRELFNSVSGHYEPVAEGRRGSRPDPFGRKPAVLQRPSQTGMDIHAPEPSPAFQTRSGSQTDGPPPWARRRGSSVSQGSMAPRRLSMNRSQEPFAPQERRMSTVAGHNMRASPTLSKTDGHPSMFSQQNAWQQQMPPPPAPGAGEELEDPFKAQERIMKEKRELALKRKVDEEEQQRQAASKERLQAKMAALQNAGQSRQEREAAAKEAAASAPKPVVEPTPEDLKPADNLAVKAVHPQEFSPAPVVQALESKVAHSLPNGSQSAQAKASPPADADLPHPISKPDGPDVPTRSVSDQTQRQAPRGPLSPKANNARAPFQQATSSPYRAPNSAFSSPGERKQQPFGRSPMVGGDGFSPWPSAGSGNVWGTAGIGNGVFESASSFAPMPMMSQQSSTLPPPPGMSRPGAQARITPPQALASESRSPSLAAAQAAEQGRAFAPPGMEGRPDHFTSQSRPTGASPTSSLSRPQRVPGPIAPPSRAQPPLQNQPAEDSRLAAWRSASQTLPAQYASNAKANGSTSHNEPPSVENGDIYRETFRQTSRGRLGGPRKIERSEYTVHDAQGSHLISSITPAPPSTQTQPAVPVPTSSPLSHPWKQAAGNTVRLPNGSMNPAHGGAAAPQPPIGAPYARAQPAPVGTPRSAKAPADPLPPTVDSKEQPPPPPETATHPVYSGDAKQPHVRLPKSRPVVKLPPPSATAPPQPSVMMPPRQHWGPPGGRPIVQNEAWQARFNGLFNRANITTETPPSPPKTPPKAYDPAFNVASSSRIAMHDPPTSTSATVSLPQMQQPTRRTTVEGFLLDDSSDVTSKDTIEQMFNEELSFGSKPLTRVPRTVVYPEIGADAVHNMLTLRPEAFPKRSEAQSKAPFDMISLHFRNPKGCFVKMPGVKTKHNPIFWRRTGLNKGTHKPKTKTVAAKETGVITPNSTVPNSASNAGSRKASSQKVSAASTPQQKSPTPGATDNAASAGSKRGFSFKAAKGRGPNASVKSTTN